MLCDIGGRASIFTPHREALRQSHGHQQHRRPHADLGIGRQQSDEDGRETHHHHRDHERALAPDAVAQRAEHERAEWPNCEPRSEGGETGEKACGLITGWKEQAAEEHGESAVEKEVVPFEDRPKRGGEDEQPGSRRCV